VRVELDAGAYRPSPVRQVIIPKPGGGDRMLGVPCVLDRLVQQAIAQVLVPNFDPQFSGASFGFRPGRSAHQAVRVARRAVEDGNRWVGDRRVLKLIRRQQGLLADRGLGRPPTGAAQLLLGRPRPADPQDDLATVEISSVNRRMRARMSGGVRGGSGNPALLLDSHHGQPRARPPVTSAGGQISGPWPMPLRRPPCQK